MRPAPTFGNGLRWSIVGGALLALLFTFGAMMRHARPTPEDQLARQLNGQRLSGPAPDLTLVRQDGTEVTLASLRGKVVFINFWATWCPPCRQEIPDLEKLAGLMRHVPFEILAVSSDESWAEIEAFFGEQGTAMLVGLDPAKDLIAARYGTEKLPETYVVDRNGQLRLRFVNVQPWTDPRIHRYLEWLATQG